MSKKGGSQKKDRLLALMADCVRGKEIPPNKRMSAMQRFNAILFLLHEYGLVSEKIYIITLAKKADVPEEYTEIVKETKQEVESIVSNWEAEWGGSNAADTTSGTAGSEKLCEQVDV